MADNKKNQILNDIINFRDTAPSHEEVSSKETPSFERSDQSSSVISESKNHISSSEKEKDKEELGTFPTSSAKMTQEGDEGIRFDFNFGIRVFLPKEKVKVKLFDNDSSTFIYEAEGESLQVTSRKKHFINARIEVEKEGKTIWSHNYDASGKNVAVVMPGGTLGDTLGWFSYALKFSKQHKCHLTIVLVDPIKDLLEPMYPDVKFVTRENFDSSIKETLYATYYLGLFFDDETNEWQPSDFRLVGLHKTAGHILGVDDLTEEPPNIYIEKESERPIKEPYVVVAVQASCVCKMWNNNLGWIDTVQYLKQKGYRVICIDREPVSAVGINWNCLPFGVEDETGSRPLSERARWLKHADFFVGLSSGLSWLAWSTRTPVVMISGFTHPSNEFYTPYRVFSSHGCNSCWHDVRTPFDHKDYMFCPRHKGTDRAFECTRIISSAYVIKTIDRLCIDHNLLKKSKRSSLKKTKKS